MNIDKLIPVMTDVNWIAGFGSLMNIDKLIHNSNNNNSGNSFGSLMNIKLKETACGIDPTPKS